MIAKVLVNSPLQVINAWEFQQFLPDVRGRGVSDFQLIIVNAGSPRSIEQSRETADRLGLRFRTIGLSGHGPMRVRKRFFQVRSEVGTLGAEDVIAVGDPSFDLYRDALARSRPAQAWVLDDGAGNWRYLKAATSGQDFPRLFKTGVGRTLAKRLIIGPTRTPGWEELRWFSLFARYLPEHSRIYQNSLLRLKRRFNLVGDEDAALFLGSPLVSLGVLSGSDYAAFCRLVAARLAVCYPGARLTYIRHRAEDEEEHGAQYFDEVEESAGPIELRWLDGARPPRAVAGVFSTALFTLGELLRDRSGIVSFWPGDGFSLMAGGRHLLELFSLFESTHADGAIELEIIER